jgi:hypothetical protein
VSEIVITVQTEALPLKFSLYIPLFYTKVPLTIVFKIFDLNLAPSNGDHPHL